MEEIWKDIKGYEGLYQVSNTGKVKSLEKLKWNGRGYQKLPERIMKGKKCGRGYLQVRLFKDGKSKNYYLHRLVAVAFIPNPDNLPQVNHRNEIKTDNCVDNLEWCDAKYNSNYGTKNQRIAEKLRGRKHSEEAIKKMSEKLRGRKLPEEIIKKIAEKNSKPVYSVDRETGLITYWKSACEASRQTGIDQGNITRCCQGKMKSAGNHIWFYADSEEVANEQEQKA